MDLQLVLVFVLIFDVSGQSHGPIFLQEPPAHLTFSNTTGTQVSCSAHGSPTPQVEWLLQDGQTVSGVPGLRQSLGNGTLYFPPFRAEDYRKDVHATVYRCRASNLAGTILSRDVVVKAVVSQHYEVQVYHTHVLAGNTAVLACVIPASVKEFVTVTSWSRDESILLPGSNMGGRMVVTYNTGELHIRNARLEDGMARYSCLTLHTLSQERKRSAPAILTVTEPSGSMPPRLAPTVQTLISAERETDIHLACSAQGNPPPTFSWYHEFGSHLQPIYASPRFEPLQDILLIRKVRVEDNGRWTCKVSNHFGEQSLDVHVTVTSHLVVHVLPQLQVINSGDNAVFNCTVSGSPVGPVEWFRNGEPLVADDRIRLLSQKTVLVNGVTRHDRGMYQCMVRNERESAQGGAELRLGDTMPELQYTFIEQALRPGPHVSLRCSATGSPPPQFRWLLDGEQVTELTAGHRYAMGQYVDQNGDVISHLNISNIKVEDGGLYTCVAVNSLGSSQHSARLDIYGPPFIRSIGPIKAVAGTNVTLHCPYSGYPISGVSWERHGRQLPADLMRHRVDEEGSFTIVGVDQALDSGMYSCFVTGRDGKRASREIQLIVHSPPVLEPFSFPVNLQEKGRAQVTCYVTSGDMPVHFTWYKDDAPISLSLQIEERAAEFYSMLIFKEVTSRHSGAYTCVASNAAARANFTAHLMVKVAPQWTTEPRDVSTLLGNSILVDCLASGYPHPEIEWLKGQGKTASDYQPVMSIPGRVSILSNGSMLLETVGPQDEGHYLCRATNRVGSGLSKVIYIGVNEPPRFDIPSKNVSTKRGNPANLHCHVYGDSPMEILWSHDGNRLDINSYRYTKSETKTDTGLKSLITIVRTDREDSGTYKCFAENPFGRAEHIINLAVQERPDPPHMLEIVEVSSRSVKLAWRRPFDGNSAIIGYLVQYQLLGSGQQWEQSGTYNLTLPAVSHMDEEGDSRETTSVGGLQPATAYKIRMLAVNSIDQSAFTEPVVAKTQEEKPSEAPRDLQIEAAGPGELFLSWNVPPRETWNGDISGYVVTWNEHGNHPNNSKTLTVKGWATTKVQLTGLKKFTRYDVNVRAFNSVGAGPASANTAGVTKEGVPEAAPQDISCSQVSSQSMKIAWTPPPIGLHGGHILGYKIYYRPLSTGDDNIPTVGEVKRTTSTETYLHGLYKYTNYSIKVLAYTGAGDGVLSSPIYCTTEEDVPGPPAQIKASALSGEAILVSWLPPEKPNGIITHYTVYAREAGRVGKHKSFVVPPEDTGQLRSLDYEMRSLTEHQLYEFWVSATTSIGEGESTPIVAQATNSRAPSRIVSFSEVIHKAVQSKVLLPCLAVGTPPPRTRWLYRDRPITFSTFYEITAEGHLNIHSADQSLAGNYTCSAKNRYGEDDITYTLIVVMPPGPPNMEVQYTTATSIRLKWTQPEDGGATIQGYTLSAKRETDDWRSIELSSEHVVYTLNDLQCGSVYYIYLIAYNRVGNGSPSKILSVNTKGGPPQLPKEKDFILTNSTTLQLNLFNWPDGGCPITKFSITYRALGEQKWTLVSPSVSGDKLVVENLSPATWYQLSAAARNDAGVADGLFNFATTSLTGGTIPPPPSVLEDKSTSFDGISFTEVYILAPIISVAVLLVCSTMLWVALRKRGMHANNPGRQDQQEEEKTNGRDNRRTCQQVYTSSPVKSSEKLEEENTGMYEISPYATFNVGGNNSRSVTTSTLDYTMQFKTFGHIEDDEHNAIIYPKNILSKHNWHKYRYGSSEVSQSSRLRPNRLATRGDSESDDTSGSPCGDFPSSTGYRIPVKSRSERATATISGFETLPVGDLFRPDSSTESNDVSPLAERRHQPRHVVASRRHHRPSSSSSSEEETLQRGVSEGNLCLEPPTGFLDSRELSETECDREIRPRKLSVELATLLERYQERKEQERREFTIHV